jgi:hypothetical protein
MRPQTAMAAILVLMLGSSVIFVRRKPDRSGPSRVSVTERGVPEQAAEEMRPEKIGIPRERPVTLGRSARRDDDPKAGSVSPFTAPPAAGELRAAPASEGESRPSKGADKAGDTFAEAPRTRGIGSMDDIGGSGAGFGAFADRSAESKKKEDSSGGPPLDHPGGAPKDGYGAAMELYHAGRFAEADKAFNDVATSGAKNAALAALYSAKSTEAAYGCTQAATKYETVAARYAGTSAAAEAQWGAANCYKVTGNLDRAYALYNQLRTVAGYRDKAEAELGNMRILQQQSAAKASRAQPPARPASPPAQAAPPQATQAPRAPAQSQ